MQFQFINFVFLPSWVGTSFSSYIFNFSTLLAASVNAIDRNIRYS